MQNSTTCTNNQQQKKDKEESFRRWKIFLFRCPPFFNGGRGMLCVWQFLVVVYHVQRDGKEVIKQTTKWNLIIWSRIALCVVYGEEGLFVMACDAAVTYSNLHVIGVARSLWYFCGAVCFLARSLATASERQSHQSHQKLVPAWTQGFLL